MIPKKIHQIWIGPNEPPLEWMESWVTFCRDYGWEYRLWREKDFPPMFNNNVYNYYRRNENWPGATDVARVEIVKREGGWYVDADSELTDPEGFANDPFQQADFVVAKHNFHSRRLLNGWIGSVPDHLILHRYQGIMSRMYAEDDLEPAWNTVGGTGLFEAVQRVGGATIVPMRTFVSDHFGIELPDDDPNYVKHHQYSTRKKKKWRNLPEY